MPVLTKVFRRCILLPALVRLPLALSLLPAPQRILPPGRSKHRLAPWNPPVQPDTPAPLAPRGILDTPDIPTALLAPPQAQSAPLALLVQRLPNDL